MMKKFLSLVVAAALVFTMSPVAAFADEPVLIATRAAYDYEANAKALNTIGLMAGDTTGDLMLGKQLTRLEGITLYFALTGQTADALALSDTEVQSILSSYTDADQITWGRNFVAYAIKTGVSIGITTTQWGPQNGLQGRMFAKWAANYLGYADVAYESALTAFAPAFAADNSSELNRDHAAGIMYTLLSKVNKATNKTVLEERYNSFVADGKTEYITAAMTIAAALNINLGTVVTPTPTPAAGPASATVKQTNTKELTVTFDKAVTGATVALKLGTIAINATVAWNADNTAATITPSVAFMANREYTVEISGIEMKANKLTVVTQTAKASALVFEPTAQITKNAVQNGANGEGYLAFTVFDQFGNEMKASAYNSSALYTYIQGAATTGRGTGTDANKIKFTFAYGAIQADKEFSYSMIDSNVSTTPFTGTAVPYAVRAVASVSFGAPVGTLQNGLIVKKTDSKLTDGKIGFYIPVEAFDQYGTAIEPSASLVTELNSKLDAISIGDNYFGVVKLLTKTANGTDKTMTAIVLASPKGIELAPGAILGLKAGTYTFKFLNTMNASAPSIVDSPAFTVEEAFKITNVTFDVTALNGIYAGESSQDYKITFTAVDQRGNAYTSLTGEQLATYIAASSLDAINAYASSTDKKTVSEIIVKSGSNKIGSTYLKDLAAGKREFTVTPKSGAAEIYSFTVNEAQVITQITSFPNTDILIDTPYTFSSEKGGLMDGTAKGFEGIKLVAQDGAFYDANRGLTALAASSIEFASDDYDVTKSAGIYTFKNKTTAATVLTINAATPNKITFEGATAGVYKIKAFVNSTAYGIVNEAAFTVTIHGLSDISNIAIEGADKINGSGNYGTAGNAAYAEDYTIYGYIGDTKYDISTVASAITIFNATVPAAASNVVGFTASGSVKETLTVTGNNTLSSDVTVAIIATLNNTQRTMTATKTVTVSKSAPATTTILAGTAMDESIMTVSGTIANVVSSDSANYITTANYSGKSVWGNASNRTPAYIKVMDQYGVENYSQLPIAYSVNYTVANNATGVAVTVDANGVLTITGADDAKRITRLEVTAIWANGSMNTLVINGK